MEKLKFTSKKSRVVERVKLLTKYIFVTGGNISGLGKGVACASIGMMLREHGYKITHKKADPYLNIDPGTQNPLEHGECYVTDGGLECDLDFGTYYRFTQSEFDENSSFTSGRVYREIIENERKGSYLGKTVQIVPHVTDLLQDKFENKTDSDICIIEIGGTIEDIEGQPFLEAARQFVRKVGRENVVFVHLTYVPFLKASKELKTKLTQQTVKNLRSMGINPDILICRTEQPLAKEIKEKISRMCDVEVDAVFEGLDVETIYDVPIKFFNQGLDKIICKKLRIYHDDAVDLKDWKKLLQGLKKPENEVTIAIAGKYVALEDAYMSVIESLKHAGAYWNTKVNIKWVDTEQVEKYVEHQQIAVEKKWACDFTPYEHRFFGDVDGILIPGGFGNRGIEGKILSVKYARESNIPFLGICLGMQVATIEYARNMADINDATSQEFSENGSHIIHYLPNQSDETDKGGTMRLGSYDCHVKTNTLAHDLYKQTNIKERHRHRYEFNNDYRDILSNAGLKISGINTQQDLVEIIEIPGHQFFIAGQFHPEFKSSLVNPHPLFIGLVDAARKNKFGSSK
ncbi:MAG: synthetase [Bacillales bacterium]|jgi:CTP synthase|nr:synthetase [Bacillales bacterium]